MNRRNHYEAAFEGYLRAERIPYVAVDEQRRSLQRANTPGSGSLKNLDFIISPGDEVRWLVDVKGRRFPSGQKHPQYWRNWTTRDELDSLASWEIEFGDGFRAALVFAYELVADRSPTPIEQVYYHQGRAYAFVGVPAAEYRAMVQPLSAKWDTVAAPVAKFREAAIPAVELFQPAWANT